MIGINAQEAATRYVRGFYFRLDPDDDRGYEEYGGPEEIEHRTPAFQGLIDHGVKILSINFMYTTSCGLTAQLELELADCSTAEEWEQASKSLHNEGFPAYIRKFLIELVDDAGNEIMIARDWSAPCETIKVIVNESL